MTPATCPDLVEALRHWQLLDASELASLAGDASLASTDPRQVARDLVHHGLLTPYQVNRLFQGQGQELVFGPYRLLDLVGEGVRGRVFKAREVRTGKVVALKILRPERLGAPGALVRLFRAAENAVVLAHPHIARSLGGIKVDGAPVLVSEYVAGPDLEALVMEKGPLPVAEACAFVRQAALGLEYALDHHIVHRNIKPRNLLLAPPVSGAAPVVKIVDFGPPAFEMQPAQDNGSPARLAEAAGEIDYIAPEQAAHPREADARSEVFSLGCTLYYLLTARLPFPGMSVLERVLARCREPARPVMSLRPEVPAALGKVVAKMMAPDPRQRYSTAGAAAEALAPFAQGEESNAAAGAEEKPRRQPGNGKTTGKRGKFLSRLSPRSLLATGAKKRPLNRRAVALVLILSALAGAVGWLIPDSQEKPKPHPSKPALVRKSTPNPEVKPQRGKTAAASKSPQVAIAPAPGPRSSGELQTKPMPPKNPPTSPDPKPKTKPKGEADPKAKPEPKAGPKPEPKTEPKPEPKTEPKPENEPKPEPKTKPITKPEPNREEGPASETKSKPKPEPAPARTERKLPVPSEDAQKKAEKLIKDLFQPEFARQAKADRKALSAQLLRQAEETKDDPAGRFVLFREARDLAIQAGELKSAFQIVDRMAQEYVVDLLDQKAAVLHKASREAQTSSHYQAVVAAARPLIREAVRADRYELALRLVALAETAVRHGTGMGLALQIESLGQEVRAIEKEYQRVKPILEAVRGPDEGEPRKDRQPEEYLAAGKFLCLLKGDWDRGLPLLVRGNDPALHALAQADLAGPKEAAAQVKLGDDWWDLAEAQKGIVKKQLRHRACFWYKLAGPRLTGLNKTKVERRVKLAGY